MSESNFDKWWVKVRDSFESEAEADYKEAISILSPLLKIFGANELALLKSAGEAVAVAVLPALLPGGAGVTAVEGIALAAAKAALPAVEAGTETALGTVIVKAAAALGVATASTQAAAATAKAPNE